MGITAGSGEVPGRKGLWQETFMSNNNNNNNNNGCVFKLGIYNYTAETNHVSREYIVPATM